MNHEKLESMSKEELISYIEEAKKRRAFTKEDQIKLRIIDELPCSMWASNRDCIITFWSDNAAALYGFSKEEAEGHDYVDMFVAEDEKVDAREDQKLITDFGKPFHNIAYDHAKNGNTLKLLTVCRRIYDPDTNEPWNAEMGIVIDYYEKELLRWEERTKHSRELKSLIAQYTEEAYRWRDQIDHRNAMLYDSIRECLLQATKARRRKEVSKNVESITKALESIREEAELIQKNYIDSIANATTKNRCIAERRKWHEHCTAVSVKIDNLLYDIIEQSDSCEVNQDLIRERDTVLGEVSRQETAILEAATKVIHSIEVEMSDYRRDVTPHPDTSCGPYKLMLDKKEAIEAVKTDLEEVTEHLHEQIRSARTPDDIITIRNSLKASAAQFEKRIEDAKKMEL